MIYTEEIVDNCTAGCLSVNEKYVVSDKQISNDKYRTIKKWLKIKTFCILYLVFCIFKISPDHCT